jgi:Putative Ig domain
MILVNFGQIGERFLPQTLDRISRRRVLKQQYILDAPSKLQYATSIISLNSDTVINPVAPVSVVYRAKTCTATPALAAGLSLSNETCAISGTPLAMNGIITYTITAMNSNGLTTARITLVGKHAIGGTLSGILTSCVVLRKDASENLTVLADGIFTFATGTPDGGTYSVSILTQPADARCIMQNGAGVANANVSNIIVTCPVGIKNGRIWMRCAHGQAWNTTAGNCTGAGNATNGIWGWASGLILHIGRWRLQGFQSGWRGLKCFWSFEWIGVKRCMGCVQQSE